MNLKRPSNKIIALIFIAFLVVGFAVFQKFFKSKATSLTVPATVEEEYGNLDYTSEQKNIDIMDTDGDGLADWQEIITGTDLNDTDTDDDGTTDGKELEFNRDPTVPGPNDQKENPAFIAEASASSTDTTISETISRNLFANAVYLSNNEGVNEENVANLVDNLISGVQSDFIYKEYMESDLPIISIETKDNLRFFASTFAALQLELLNTLAETQDMAALSKIYSEHAKTLYTIPTPKELASNQVKIINNFSKISSVYDALAKQKEDPLKLPLAMRAYQEAGVEQEGFIIEVGFFLNKNDIINLLDESAKNYWLLAISE